MANDARMRDGTYVALVTPFRGGAVDRDALAALVDSLLAERVEGLVPCGTTGEASTLTDEEHLGVIRFVAERVAGRAVVLAGTGSNDTTHAIRLTRAARERGADAALVVSPYYNKPTQDGLYRHFRKIAEEGGLPMMLYNIPGRCGVEISVETIARLRRDCPPIVAIKHATGSMDGASALRTASDIAVFSGDDSMTLPLMSIGARGVVSVIGNAWPAEVKAMVDAALAGDFARAREIHLRTFRLAQGLLSIASNPIPIKTVLARRGMMAEEFRLPMCPMSAAEKDRLFGLITDFDAAVR